jgi:hypothetical protein
VTPLRLDAVGMKEGALSFSWSSQPGRRYRVESTPDLGNPAWQTNREVVAESAIVAFTDAEAASTGRRFYRVLLLP